MTSLLLDTCAAIWVAEKEVISEQAVDALNGAVDKDEPVYVSMITSWEIGLLVARGRLPLSMDPLAWFERLLDTPGVRLADISPRILVGSSFLPGRPPNDPMDRIILATAREGGYRLMTRDKHLLAYAHEGHIQAVAC
ncbi:MAG TPA: type II toxin-antitoxin system VapC family toxin [Micropepsaceae bacterium]|nr:type II toxin-antitoxin system VapC family toxin [Micropepsaceae bacterium]